MRVGMVFVILAASLISGCIGSSETGGFATAGELRWNAGRFDQSLAEAELDATAADAELIALIGLESADGTNLSFPSAHAFTTSHATSAPDAALGDGRAALWVSVHRVNGTDRHIVATHHGRDLASVDVVRDPGTLWPYLGQFRGGEAIAEHVDSDTVQALDTPFMPADAASGSVIMVLHHPSGGTAYWAYAHHDGATLKTHVVLDATTGEKKDAAAIFQHAAPVQESARVLLTPAGTESITIAVDAAYRGLAVRISAATAANPAAHVHASLSDPNGRDAGLSDASWPEPIVTRIPDAAPGEWTLVMGAYAPSDATHLVEEVTVEWCTDGARHDPLGLTGEAAKCL